MKAACLLIDSMYSLAVSDSGGIGAGNGTLGLGFAGIRKVAGGDGMTGAGSIGRGGVSEVSIGTGSWPSGVGVGSGTGVEVGPGTGAGASCCGRSASDVLASDPGASLPPDSVESRVVLRVVGVSRTLADPSRSHRLPVLPRSVPHVPCKGGTGRVQLA